MHSGKNVARAAILQLFFCGPQPRSPLTSSAGDPAAEGPSNLAFRFPLRRTSPESSMIRAGKEDDE